MDSCNKIKKYAPLDEPLVTVCITSYNRPEGLDRVLQCICNQSYRNLQIIISDDFSPDVGVKKTILKHSAEDKRVEYFLHSENLRYIRNLKFSLDRARGDFIMWCDDDDWYHGDFIQKCLSALLLHPKSGTAFCYYIEADEFGVKTSGYPNQDKLLEKLTNRSVVKRILSYLFSFNGYGYCNIYYGIHRKSMLTWFDPGNFDLTLDKEFGMKQISISPLLLVREYLFKKTIGNEKKYIEISSLEENNSRLKIISNKTFEFFKNCIKMVKDYIYVLRLDYAIIIAIFSPIWILMLIFKNIIHMAKKYNK